MLYLFDPNNENRYCGTTSEDGATSTKFSPPALNFEWCWVDEMWIHRPKQKYLLPIIEFKLRFTIAERLAIKSARGIDPVIDDVYSLLDDPRTTHVNTSLTTVQEMLQYLVFKGLITAERIAEIVG